jgi:predicted tellurium resistance membrane protein TerC
MASVVATVLNAAGPTAGIAVLEVLFSGDNALALSLSTCRLPPRPRKLALTGGLPLGFFLRALLVLAIQRMSGWSWLRLVCGLYLVFLGLRAFFRSGGAKGPSAGSPAPVPQSLWRSIARVEAINFVLSFDSALAEAGVQSRFWVLFVGACVGMVIVRFATRLVVRLMSAHPRLETVVQILVLLIGVKMLYSWRVGQPIGSWR